MSKLLVTCKWAVTQFLLALGSKDGIFMLLNLNNCLIKLFHRCYATTAALKFEHQSRIVSHSNKYHAAIFYEWRIQFRSATTC